MSCRGVLDDRASQRDRGDWPREWTMYRSNCETRRGLHILQHLPGQDSYGSDPVMNPQDDPKAIAEQIRPKWLSDWAYLATDSTLTLSNVPGPVRALGLPRDVIEMYRGNAERMLGQIWRGEWMITRDANDQARHAGRGRGIKRTAAT